ncbi:hypothetical protein [Antrihabitans spumae]|uniref:Uncharacterized protein n=1 Tax=Antrihabitans spumae TaxID=3373370 RepID=A0ABW7KAD3_9NOCA
MAVDSSGTTFVSEFGSQFGAGNLKYLRNTDATPTLLQGGLQDPEGLAIDTAGNLIFAELRGGTIKMLPKN